MKVLVTGGAGFIGSNFVRHLLARGQHEVVVLDALTYAGNLENLHGLDDKPGFAFVRGDICSAEDVSGACSGNRFDAMVNFAAETHVDRSLEDAYPFIRTNVTGTQVLLDACREHSIGRFLQVSTDEVYGTIRPGERSAESAPVVPNNPYAATKASADFLVRAARESHGLETLITRCSNNFGPYQFPEKLIPLMITNAMADEPLPVYGDGQHVRDWIFVGDHCAALSVVLEKGEPGGIYNIGGRHDDMTNLKVVKTILRVLDKPETLIRHVADRPGHDRRYAMDCTMIAETLGWQPTRSFEEALRETIAWYEANTEWSDRIRSGEYAGYYNRMYAERLRGNGVGDNS
jgi:dTDP-glucose 4,6-dehydratase